VKVLLTGGAGFIGSHVARQLIREGHEVHALVRAQTDLWRVEDIRSNLRLVVGDILDSSFFLNPSSYDVCIHLAWYVEPGKYLHAPQNKDWVKASMRLARLLQDMGCRRFVGAGTCFEYAQSDESLSETNATAPSTVYTQSKLDLFAALQSLDMEVVWLRFFYQYGPYEDPRRFVPVVINSLLRGQEAKLVPGDRRRDYLHIEDDTSAVTAVAQSKLTGAVNIGSGVPVTVREIGLKIGELLGKPKLVKLAALPYSLTEPMHIVADNTKLRSTGWKSRYDLASGLRQTIDWWKRRV
jgi:nucleoside-diphosphate-sugar epimerase